jgi:hypothetical protein
LWEAFLLQMNEFDQFLELKLRQMLDSVVASQPPARKGRLKRLQKPILAVVPAAIGFAAGAIPVVEPVVVTMPVASARQL